MDLALEERFSAVAESLEMNWPYIFGCTRYSAASLTNLLSDSLTMAIRLERLLLLLIAVVGRVNE